MSELNLHGEIAALRKLIEKRLADVDKHTNPHLDSAIAAICEAANRIESLVNTQHRLDTSPAKRV